MAQILSYPFRDVHAGFYINRAGKNLDPEQKSILEAAKTELRKRYSLDFLGSEAGWINTVSSIII